jgi:hypothetical protein
MQAPPKVRKNFIALVSETAEEHEPRRAGPASGGLLAKAILALAAIWPRSRDAS